MRTAVCVFGLPRGNKSSWHSLVDYVVNPLAADLFVHSWRLPGRTENWHGAREPSNDQFSIMTSCLDRRAKNGVSSFCADIQKQYDPATYSYNDSIVYNSNAINMWLSINRVRDLAVRFGLECDQQYDQYIFTRSDVLFSSRFSYSAVGGSKCFHAGVWGDSSLHCEDVFFSLNSSSLFALDLILTNTKLGAYPSRGVRNPLIWELQQNGIEMSGCSNYGYGKDFIISRPRKSFLELSGSLFKRLQGE